jgi:hypothetical protein
VSTWNPSLALRTANRRARRGRHGSWRPTGGRPGISITVNVELDLENVIVEWNERNNTFSQTFVVPAG